MTPLEGVVATSDAAGRRADLERLKEGAALLVRHGNRAAALAVLWVAVAIDPQDHAVHRRLAATLASAGDLDGAALEYARYVEFLLAQGELEAATAELDYAARTLGRVQPLPDAVTRLTEQLPAVLEASRQRVVDETVVQLPIAQLTRVTFYTCLHNDGEATWLQLEGGTADLVPEQVRLLRGATVLESRRCIPMPIGRKSHARKDGDSKVWVVLRAPEDMLGSLDRDEGQAYVVKALVNGEWVGVDLEDTGCRFGMERTGRRSA